MAYCTSPFALFFVLVLYVVVSTTATTPEITIGQSAIRGQVLETSDKKEYWSFKGIRYAEAPTGKNRFQKPIPADLPELTVADHYGNACLPIGHEEQIDYDEDCLFLNVFCPPKLQDAEPKAVILYIHGGGNIFGTPIGREGTSLVVDHDVIMVTTNYRLGPMGYLTTGDSAASGNAGLFDQNLAIKWVSKNIAHFGGDPKRFTVMGESAGGKSTSSHTVSPYSRDLFQRAIMLSGSVYGPSLYAWAPEDATRVVATRVGCLFQDNVATVECLQKVNATDLIKAADNIWPDDNMRTILDFWWGAIRDGDFIPHDITPGLFEGEVLLSNNNNEGSLYPALKLPLVKENDEPYVAKVMEQAVFKQDYIYESVYQYFLTHPNQKMIYEIYDLYVGEDHEGPVDMEMLMNLYADQQYVYPTFEYLNKRINKGKSYFYYFDRYLQEYEKEPSYMHGSAHTDDLRFILNTYTRPATPLQADIEAKVAKGMQIYISNFAKSGDPNKPVTPPVPFVSYFDTDHPKAFLRVTGNTNKSGPTDLFDGNGTNNLPERMSLWSTKLAPALRVGTKTRRLPDNGAEISLSANTRLILFCVACLAAALNNYH